MKTVHTGLYSKTAYDILDIISSYVKGGYAHSSYFYTLKRDFNNEILLCAKYECQTTDNEVKTYYANKLYHVVNPDYSTTDTNVSRWYFSWQTKDKYKLNELTLPRREFMLMYSLLKNLKRNLNKFSKEERESIVGQALDPIMSGLNQAKAEEINKINAEYDSRLDTLDNNKNEEIEKLRNEANDKINKVYEENFKKKSELEAERQQKIDEIEKQFLAA